MDLLEMQMTYEIIMLWLIANEIAALMLIRKQ